MKMKKKKTGNKPDKKFTSLDSIKYKNIIYEVGCRFRINKPIGKMKKEQLVELLQINSESTCKIQSAFDHSTEITNFLDLSDF
jgi:hypothetical protein